MSLATHHKRNVTICCSGGLDSTALVHYYLSKGFTVQGVFFEYSQPAFAAERRSVKAIAEYYKISIKTACLRPAISASGNGEYYGRNLLFVLSALNLIRQTTGLISLGIHTHATYYDCTPDFVRSVQSILDGYYHGTVLLDVPFLSYDKGDIVAYARTHRVPIELTYSCERHSDHPCGKCLSCKERTLYDPNYSIVQTKGD